MRGSMRNASVRAGLALAVCLLVGSAGAAAAGLLGIGYEVLYDINTSTGAPTNPRSVGNKINSIACSPSGTLYGVSQGFPSDFPPGGRLFTINPTSGAATLVATLDTYVIVEGDIACDPTSGLLYAVDSQGQLFTINTTSGAGTVIGTVPGNRDLSAMAFDASGNLYMVDSFGPSLLKVNKATAAIVTSTPLDPVNQEIGGLAFAPGSGTLYYAGGTSSRLYILNTGTGAATTLGPIAASGGIWGLTFLPDATPARPSSWGSIKSLYR